MENLHQAIETLQDAQVRAFLSRELYHYVDRATFDGLAMPDGCAADELWELLCTVRSVMSTVMQSELSNVGARGELWFVCTPEMTAALAGVADLSDEASHIAGVLATQPGRVLCSQPFIEELCAALRRDGVETPADAMASLVRGDRAPDGPVDVLVRNALAILGGIVDYARSDAYADVAEALGVAPVRSVADAVRALHAVHDRLDEGVGPFACAGPRRLAMPYYPTGRSTDTVLASVVELYLSYGEKGIDPLVTFVSGADVFGSTLRSSAGTA